MACKGIPAAFRYLLGTVGNTVQGFGQNLLPSGIIPTSLRRFKNFQRRQIVVGSNFLMSQELI